MHISKYFANINKYYCNYHILFTIKSKWNFYLTSKMSTTLCQSDYVSQRDLVSLYSLMIWNLLIVAKSFKTLNIWLIPWQTFGLFQGCLASNISFRNVLPNTASNIFFQDVKCQVSRGYVKNKSKIYLWYKIFEKDIIF